MIYAGFSASDMLPKPETVVVTPIGFDEVKRLLQGTFVSRCFPRFSEEALRLRSLGLDLPVTQPRTQFLRPGDVYVEVIPRENGFSFKKIEMPS